MIKLVINVDTPQLKAVTKRLKTSKTRDKVFSKIIGSVYAEYTRSRFDRLSNQKAGEWPALAAQTLARKRPETRKLVHTGQLRAAIFSARGKATDVGYRTQQVPYGSRIEYAVSSARHKKAKMPVSRLLTIHDRGYGNVPQRRILVKTLPQRHQLETRKRIIMWIMQGKET